MLVSRSKQICFIWAPKCGGHSIQRIMVDKHGARPWPRRKSLHDWSNRKFRDYFRFAVVRNPYERMVSYYFWLRRGVERRVRPLVRRRKHLATFATFLQWIPHWRPPHRMYNYRQSSFLKGCLLNAIARLETLASDLHQFGVIESTDELPRLNVKQYPKPMEKFLTEENRAIIARICRPDFEQYEYPIDYETERHHAERTSPIPDGRNP